MGKSKIETELSEEQLQDFCSRLANTPKLTLKKLQSMAAELGIEVSLMGAKSFRDGAFAEHIEKMRRAKTFLLLRGAGFFYICSLIIYIATGLGYFGSELHWSTFMPRFGFALLFSVCLTAEMLVSERIRFQLYASQAPSRT